VGRTQSWVPSNLKSTTEIPSTFGFLYPKNISPPISADEKSSHCHLATISTVSTNCKSVLSTR
jgi:hypothetical protein